MAEGQGTNQLLGHRVDALEELARRLQEENQRLKDSAVSHQWLDERFARLHDQMQAMSAAYQSRMDVLAEDIRDMKTVDRTRRLAVFSAVAIGVVSLITSLFIAAASQLPPALGG